MVKIRDVDLNLLRVFECVFQTRKVVEAAEILGISQPAVSNALKKLRELFNDELFVRTRSGMTPTQYAMQLAEPISYALKTLEIAIEASESFDPRRDKRHFVIATSDLGDMYFGPKFISHIRDISQDITIEFVRNNRPHIVDSLENGEVDILIGFRPDLITNMFVFRLFYQGWSILARKDHPIFSSKAPREDLLACRWIGVRSEGSGLASVNAELLKVGMDRNIVVWTSNFGTLAPLLAVGDLAACVPEKYTTVIDEAFGLKSMPFPVDLPKHSISSVWHSRAHNDPANQWLRQQVSILFKEA